jgi:hypothetical protein
MSHSRGALRLLNSTRRRKLPQPELAREWDSPRYAELFLTYTRACSARPNGNGYEISQASSESPATTPPQTFQPAVQQGAPQQKPQSFPWTVRRLQLPPPEIFSKQVGVAAPTHPSPSPFPRSGLAMPTIPGSQGELYIFGGLVKDDLRNDLYRLNTRELSAKLVQTGGERPVKRVGHASAIVSSVLIVWGGDTKKDSNHNPGDNLDDGLYLLNLGELWCSAVWHLLIVRHSLQRVD